jgi:urocanate hydratase
MTSAGVTVVADGTLEGAERLSHALNNDTTLGVIRYADTGYPESSEEIEAKSVPYIRLG